MMVAPKDFLNHGTFRARYWYRSALSGVQALDALIMHVEGQGWDFVAMSFSGIVAPPPANLVSLDRGPAQGIPLIAVTFRRIRERADEIDCPEFDLPGGPSPIKVA